MRLVKISIVIMTTLLVAGLGLLVYGFATQSRTSSIAPDAEFEVPQGSAIRQMTGYKDGLAFYLSTPKGEFVYLYNPTTGKPAGRIAVKQIP